MTVTVLLDMDGVLVDFVRGAARWHGFRDWDHSKTGWNFERQMWPDLPADAAAKKFWSPLGHNFWSALHWTPFGRELLAGVNALVGPENVLFTSSPCDTPGCEEGKRAWLRYEIPEQKDNFNFCRKKHLLSKPFTVLVDDSDKNVEAFDKGHGFGVLVPQPWNIRRGFLTTAGNPDMKYLLGRVEAAVAQAADPRSYHAGGFSW